MCAGKKVLVFAHHGVVLDALEGALAKLEHGDPGAGQPGHIRIDGSHSVQQRQAAVECFQGLDTCRVALLSIMAAGVNGHCCQCSISAAYLLPALSQLSNVTTSAALPASASKLPGRLNADVCAACIHVSFSGDRMGCQLSSM
jgi:hypothetical protein